jgi:hypothetical protein
MENLELITLLLKQCAKKGLTPMLWGRHGIGKSMIIRSLFEKLGYEVFDLRLGQMEAGDLVGMPAQEYYCPSCQTKYGFAARFAYCPMCEQKGSKIPICGQTVWLPPSWFPQHGEKRVIFFDEFNRGRLDVMQAAFQIVLDRRVHTHKFPEGTVVICACNPPSTDAGTGQEYNVEEIDPALLDRFVNIKFTLTTDNWLRWARENNIMQDIVDFIATEPKFLGNDAIDIPIEISPSPRSYEFLSKVLADGEIPTKYWVDVAETIIGSPAAIAFVQSIKTDIDKPIKAKEIFDNFAKVLPKLEAQCNPDKTRFDLLRLTLDECEACLEGDKSKKYTAKQLNNFADFMLRIPQDLSFSVLKKLAGNNDINERLLLHRDDLFKILKSARKGDVNG